MIQRVLLSEEGENTNECVTATHMRPRISMQIQERSGAITPIRACGCKYRARIFHATLLFVNITFEKEYDTVHMLIC